MDTVKMQIILYWFSVSFFILGTVLFVSGLMFKKEKNSNYAAVCSFLGILPLTAALILRWQQTGHFPYWGLFEVFPAYAWVAVLFYLVVQYIKPVFRIVGTLVLPFAFFMIGIGIMSSPEVQDIPRTFFTYWLGVHVAFAKLSYGSVLISAGLAIAYLAKKKQQARGQVHPILAKLPDLENLDFYSYRFAAFAFVMLGIMIASGAVWAYKAWGRYWAWDPIETWALISWLIYGLYLHLRVTMGWHGTRASKLAIFALIMVIFSFFGIPFFYPSAHEHLEYSILIKN